MCLGVKSPVQWRNGKQMPGHCPWAPIAVVSLGSGKDLATKVEGDRRAGSVEVTPQLHLIFPCLCFTCLCFFLGCHYVASMPFLLAAGLHSQDSNGDGSIGRTSLCQCPSLGTWACAEEAGERGSARLRPSRKGETAWGWLV